MDGALLFTCLHSQLMRTNVPFTSGLTCVAFNGDNHCLVKKEKGKKLLSLPVPRVSGTADLLVWRSGYIGRL